MKKKILIAVIVVVLLGAMLIPIGAFGIIWAVNHFSNRYSYEPCYPEVCCEQLDTSCAEPVDTCYVAR